MLHSAAHPPAGFPAGGWLCVGLPGPGPPRVLCAVVVREGMRGVHGDGGVQEGMRGVHGDRGVREGTRGVHGDGGVQEGMRGVQHTGIREHPLGRLARFCLRLRNTPRTDWPGCVPHPRTLPQYRDSRGSGTYGPSRGAVCFSILGGSGPKIHHPVP